MEDVFFKVIEFFDNIDSKDRKRMFYFGALIGTVAGAFLFWDILSGRK